MDGHWEYHRSCIDRPVADALLPSLSGALAGCACTLPDQYCRLRVVIALAHPERVILCGRQRYRNQADLRLPRSSFPIKMVPFPYDCDDALISIHAAVNAYCWVGLTMRFLLTGLGLPPPPAQSQRRAATGTNCWGQDQIGRLVTAANTACWNFSHSLARDIGFV